MIQRRGILLAGGSGLRLYPATISISKQLLPIYDKPMVYYPLSTLMLMGIRDVLIISTPQDTPRFQQLLGDGSAWGMHLEYLVQPRPEGIAQAMILGKVFLQDQPSALILGDNLFFGANLGSILSQAAQNIAGATIFAHPVQDPQRYGVVTFDKHFKATELAEKPHNPKSHFAIAGLYLYDALAPEYAQSLTPSQRGELEITDLNQIYLEKNQLKVVRLGRGFAWLDTGTHQALLQASKFIEILEERQGQKIGCPEEIAWRNGWITQDNLMQLAQPLLQTPYGNYLQNLINE